MHLLQPVARAMAVAKRSGPDFLFLANANSQKFDDLEKNKVATVYFHNSDNQDWISVTGEAGECTMTKQRNDVLVSSTDQLLSLIQSPPTTPIRESKRSGREWSLYGSETAATVFTTASRKTQG